MSWMRGGLRGLHDLLEARLGPAEGDVLADAHREEQGRLQDHRDLAAQRRGAGTRARPPRPPARGRGWGRRSGAAGSAAWTCRRRWGRPPRRAARAPPGGRRRGGSGRPGRTGSPPPPRRPRRARPPPGSVAGAVGQVPLHVHHVEHALHADPRALGQPVDLEHVVDRAVERGQVGDEHHQAAHGEGAVEDVAGADPHHRRGPEGDHQVDDARVEGLQRVEAEAGVQAPLAARS